MIDLDTLTADCQRVKEAADRILEAARQELERLDRAHGSPAEPAIAYAVTVAVAEIDRQLTRAQAELVARSDRRYRAAQLVLDCWDDADRRRLPAVRVGIAS